jgi:hypothetical protein
MEIRLDADIIPNESLGGLTLRSKIADLQQLIYPGGWPPVEHSYELVRPFEARYYLADGAVTLAVDVRNGRIFKLSAGQGYTGTLFGRIKVGMRVSEAMSVEPRLYYDETEESILCKGIKGLTIDIPEIDPPAALVGNLNISAISVYADETNTWEGQWGHWW